METITLIFPHQLFEDCQALQQKVPVYLIEEYLFFRQYKFHKQKLAYHRATMKWYENYLVEKGFKVDYIESSSKNSDIRKLITHLSDQGIKQIYYTYTADNWLEKRIQQQAKKHTIEVKQYQSPGFINSIEDIKTYFANRKNYSQTEFYIYQRKERQYLVDENLKPKEGKWSFDKDNREKYPQNKKPPQLDFPKPSKFYQEAIEYVNKNFDANYGQLNEAVCYPNSFEESKQWLETFFSQRFELFGKYEDAILKNEKYLNHSLLSPMLNIGLITPEYIVNRALEYADKHKIPINSLEGFIRQLIGWREFIHAIYFLKGSKERTTNFWNHSRKIPTSFYQGNTGIKPVDDTIKQVLKTGYCHHIERLMILGNFMLLCQFDPDEVYKWFMELFIDAYDWVMVPNVYGMSQFADGGVIATKPYISSSNYIFKMSDYKKNDSNKSWIEIWDGLFWNFMDSNRNFFKKTPRLAMLISAFDKMPEEKQQKHLQIAKKYIKNFSE